MTSCQRSLDPSEATSKNKRTQLWTPSRGSPLRWVPASEGASETTSLKGMGTHRATTTDRVRAARAAAAMSLQYLADVHGTSAAALTRTLHSLGSRGRCADIAARAAAGSGAAAWEALVHPMLAPPTARAAAATLEDPRSREDMTGVAAWRSKAPTSAVLARPAAVALAGDVNEKIRARVASNAGCPPVLMHRFAVDKAWVVRCAAATNPTTGRQQLEMLASDNNPDVRSVAAARPDCPQRTLQQLAADSWDVVREMCAANPSASKSILDALYLDNYPDLKHFMAPNPACGPELLERLAEHPAPEVRQAVIANPACGPELVAKIAANDTHPETRAMAATHPDAPPDAVAAIIDSSDYDTWTALAACERCPNWVFAELASWEHIPSMAAAAANPAADDAALRKLMITGSRSALLKIAANPNCRVSLWRSLLRGDEAVTAAAAANPSGPADDLRTLASETQPIRRGLASNPSCPPDVLKTLVTDPDTQVRAAAATNPRCGRQALDTLAGDVSAQVRAAAATNPRCGSGLLEMLASGHDWDVSTAVLAAPACPPHVLAASLDEDYDLRFVARLRIPEMLASRSPR